MRIPWDKFEAALLLDYCIKVEEGKLSRESAVKEVSQKLRKRAMDKGIPIDDIFRNENGISMQLSSMRNCYLGKEKGLTISNLFREIVALYKNDKNAFMQILDEGQVKMNTSVWQEFIQWLQKEYPQKHEEIESALKTVNAIGIKKGLLKQNINNIENADEIKDLQEQISQKSFFPSKKMRLKGYQSLSVYAEFLSKRNSDEEYKESDKGEEINKGQSNGEVGVLPDSLQKSQYKEDLFNLVSTHYKYGFPIDSILDLMRFRNFAEEVDVQLPKDDEDLQNDIKALGVLYDNKIYAWSDELVNEAGFMLSDIFQSGVKVVFLQSFYEINSVWMEEHFIASTNIIKLLLEQSHPEYYFGQNIVTSGQKKNETEAIVEEIYRVSENNSIILVSELTEKLLYIPDEKISFTLSYSSDFIHVCENKYFRMDSFVINEKDCSAIIDFVSEECNKKGYASLTDIPLGDVSADNYELPEDVLQIAIFEAVLKDSYYLNGKIITSEKKDINIQTLLEEYCKDREECSLTEVIEEAKELTGKECKQYSLIALYDKMVRIGPNEFISENQVYFDIDQIDKILQEVIGKRFGPIKTISTFALFPPCGPGWNYYVLESYCYRFSRKYNLLVKNYNDKNAGVILSKDLHISYDEMLSEAAAKSNIDLTPEEVGQYFFENGYTAKRKYANIHDIIKRAKEIRKEL